MLLGHDPGPEAAPEDFDSIRIRELRLDNDRRLVRRLHLVQPGDGRLVDRLLEVLVAVEGVAHVFRCHRPAVVELGRLHLEDVGLRIRLFGHFLGQIDFLGEVAGDHLRHARFEAQEFAVAETVHIRTDEARRGERVEAGRVVSDLETERTARLGLPGHHRGSNPGGGQKALFAASRGTAIVVISASDKRECRGTDARDGTPFDRRAAAHPPLQPVV